MFCISCHLHLGKCSAERWHSVCQERSKDSSCLPSLLLPPWNSTSINIWEREASSDYVHVPNRHMSSCTQRKAFFLYITNITHALGTKSKTKFPLKSVNTLSRETCLSNHRLTCEWQRLKLWPWLICVFQICHTGVSAVAQPPKERHAQSFPWPTETFSVSVLAAGCNSICYGIHA